MPFSSHPLRRQRQRLMAGVFAAVALLAACQGSQGAFGRSEIPASVGSTDSLSNIGEQAVRGLCEVEMRLSSGVPAAEGVFEDRVHDQLHVLASRLKTAAPAAAARLLEAKERVESAFGQGKDPDMLGRRIDELVDAVIEGLERGGTLVRGCS